MIDWNAKEAYAKNLTVGQLHYAIRDCVQAANAMRGWNPDREGCYMDECSVYRMELNRREKQ